MNRGRRIDGLGWSTGLGGASAAHAAPAAPTTTTCSTAYLGRDFRLGPATTPDRGQHGRHCQASGLRGAWVTEAPGGPSHLSEAPDVLTCWNSVNRLRTCLTIGETTDIVDCLTRKALSMPHDQRDGKISFASVLVTAASMSEKSQGGDRF